MKTFVCRLSGEDIEAIAKRDTPREVSLCCLVQAEDPEGIEDPLRDVVRRLHAAPSGALESVRELYLDDIIELADKPGSGAVLWVTSRIPGKAPGSVIHPHLPLPIDDSGSMTAYGHGANPDEHVGEDIESEPFVVFDALPSPARARPKSGSSKPRGASPAASRRSASPSELTS
jgi:hypothetical protein